jgi:2-polyprenyl-3-methyl-5-hydroxy-6-metoxy-1,4-benzoquinol methylase
LRAAPGDRAAAERATPFACPRCRAPLEWSDDAHACAGCGAQYPDREGIASFTDAGYFYGTLPRESLEQVIALAAAGRMDEVRRFLAERKVKGRKVFLRSFHDGFADGRFVAPIDAASAVLDLGCGYGGLSVPLARSCARVFALDATFERVKMVALRAQHEGLANLTPVHANALALPFAPASFDCVLLNGVLEWVGEWDTSRRPRDVQVSVLRSCAEVLKPGGTVYLAIENRWAAELVYRRKDHNKLYWTSFLPRPAADVATRALKRKPYRTYTYGRRGLTALLAEAGFARVELYCPWARYQDPDFVVRVGDEGAFTHFRRTALASRHPAEARAFAVLQAAGLHWDAAPAWIAVGHKP